GFGTLTVKADGSVVLAGSLADSTAVAQSTTISGNGNWPFYASLYGGKGSILGWITFANTADTSFSGNVLWMNPGVSTSKYYPRGFTNAMEVVGSSFVTPASGTAALTT